VITLARWKRSSPRSSSGTWFAWYPVCAQEGETEFYRIVTNVRFWKETIWAIDGSRDFWRYRWPNEP
jgi:hypothetical protein